MDSSAQEAAKMASHFIPTCWLCDKAISLESCSVDEYGKGVHEECYAAKLARRNTNPGIREKEERAWELCALANNEQDRQKLLAHMQEIRQLLEETKRPKYSGSPPADS